MREPEGLFETLRARNGRLALWGRHYERLSRSAAELEIPPPPSADDLETAAMGTLESLGLENRDAVIRITLRRVLRGESPRDSAFRVTAEPLEARLWAGTRSGAATAILSSGPFEPGPFARHKTLDRRAYEPARVEARVRGADEALLVSPRGEILEGTVSNVFAVFGNEITTPPLGAGILPGIMRALVLETCRARGLETREEALTRERLLSADEVFLTNAVQRVVPLAILEGERIPAHAIGLELMQICDMLADGGNDGL